MSSRGAASAVHHEEPVVFFDLETTGLDVSVCEIVQLSAISGEKSFNVYMLPRCRMTEEASRITGFMVEDQTLLLHGQPVPTVPLRQALTSFIAYLSTFNKPLLAAHNAKRFDCPVLARVLVEFSLMELQHVVSGFLDTFLISKALFAGTSVRKFSQQYLVNHFLNKTYDAHNALEDVKALQELYHVWNPSSALVRRQRFTLLQVCSDPLEFMRPRVWCL